MTLISLETRLRRIETARARSAFISGRTRAERDAAVTAALALPDALTAALAAAAAEPNAATREQHRAAIEAAWRADA